MTTLTVKQKFKGVLQLFSDSSLTKKAYLNSLAAALDYGARLLVGFIIIPFLVAGLGDFLYGIWVILGRLTGYLTATSGRSTQALKWVIANKQRSSDYVEKRRCVSSAVVVWIFFLPLQAGLGAVLVWFVPLWLHVPEEFSWVVRVAAVILVARLILTNLVNVPRSVLEGENLGYKRMGLSATLILIGGGLTLLALHFNTGLPGLAVASLTTSIVTGLLFVLIVRVYIPWFGFARPSGMLVRRFFGLGWWFLAWRLIMQLMMAGDIVILGMLATAEMVTVYSLTKYLPEVLINLVAIVVFGITPGLGGIIGGGDLQKAASVRGEIMLLSWLVLTTVGATMLLWNDAFLRLWVGAEYYAGSSSTLLILLMVTQLILIRNDANVIDLTLDLRRKVLLGASSTALSLVLVYTLVGWFNAGVTGLCLGFIAGRSILSVCYPVMVGRILRISWGSQLTSLLRPGLITILLFSLLSRLSALVIAGSWANLSLAVLATLSVVSVFTFYAGLPIRHRDQILQRVRTIIAIG